MSTKSAEPLLDSDGPEFSTSPWRWVVLAAYCTLPTVQNIAYIVYGTIVQNTADYYHVSNNSVIFLANLANIMLVPSMVVMMPLPTIFSLKVTVQITGVIIGLAGCLRLLATGPGHFGLMIFAQAVNGIPGPILMNIPALLSATWFPPSERVAATSVAFVCQSLGIGLGFLLGPWIVTSPDKVKFLNEVLAVLGGEWFSRAGDVMVDASGVKKSIQIIYTFLDENLSRCELIDLFHFLCQFIHVYLSLSNPPGFVVFVVLFFPHNPQAPSASAATKKHSFLAGMKILVTHRSYLVSQH
jgi:hypothetical protein